MMTKIGTLSCLLLLADLFGCGDAFGVQPKGSLSSLLSENSRRRSSLRYQNEVSPTSTPASTKHGLPKLETNSRSKTSGAAEIVLFEDEWDLREDWALQDSVPRYTVNGATFWTQLKHSTPELAKRSEEELEQRYKEWYSSAEDSLLVECGPSPIVLSDWRVSTAAPLPSRSTSRRTTPTTTMMSGSLPNGSQIWFPLKCAGTLGDDPCSEVFSSVDGGITQDTLDDCFISASMTMHTSSYGESVGGVVYELGAPRCEAHRVHSSRQSLGLATGTETVPSPLAVTTEDPADVRTHLEKFTKRFTKEASKNVGTLSAIVAASTMSACLAMGYTTGEMQAPSSSTPSVAQNRNGDIVAGVSRTGHPIYFSSERDGPEISIGEKRARAELKVGLDKRDMVRMQDRLQKDEARLQELRQEESRVAEGRGNA